MILQSILFSKNKQPNQANQKMYKIALFVIMTVVAVSAKPGILAPVAYSQPLVAAPAVVTAQSSQVIARNYNGLAAAPLVAAPAPLIAASAPLIAGPAAYAAAPVAYTARAFGYPSVYANAAYTSPYLI